MVTIGIVGGGFSGLMTAYHLLSNTEKPLKLTLFNHRFPSGKGIAYSTSESCHLLNVPAGKMSALPEDPGHFTKWLDQNHNLNSGSFERQFVPRKSYGAYLDSIYRMVRSNPSVKVIEKEVIDISSKEGEYYIHCNDHIETVHTVVLATGNLLPDRLINIESDHYIRNPWNFDEIHAKATDAKDLMIIGSGLSMVDIIMSLDQAGINTKVTCISSNGGLPQPHVSGKEYPGCIGEVNEFTDINNIFRIIKKHLKKADENGYTRQSVIDSLRPYVQEIWVRLDETCKARFVRHLKHGWNVLRHRIPSETSEVIERWRKEGKLDIIAGKIVNAEKGKDGLDLTVKLRNNEMLKKQTSLLINCTGPQMDYRNEKEGLYANIFKRALAFPGALGLGLHADVNCQLLDKKNRRINNIYTLGPTLKSILWETTAVNEIRNQAKKTAKTILIENGLIT